MKQRVAVVGSSGFVGQALVMRLSELGIDTIPLNRGNSPDLVDQHGDWASLFLGCSAVVNCAGKAHDLRELSVDDARAYALVNGLAPRMMARAAVEAGVTRFVQISTVKVLGERTYGRPFEEGDPRRPVGVYALSKALGEELVLGATADTGTSGVIIRIPLVIGRPFKGNLALLEKAVTSGVPLPLGHHSVAKRSYVQRDDLIKFIVAVLAAPVRLTEVLHVRSHPDLTAAELAELVGSEVGRRPRLISVPAPVLSAAATLIGRREVASKMTGEMLMSDKSSRNALRDSLRLN